MTHILAIFIAVGVGITCLAAVAIERALSSIDARLAGWMNDEFRRLLEDLDQIKAHTRKFSETATRT